MGGVISVTRSRVGRKTDVTMSRRNAECDACAFCGNPLTRLLERGQKMEILSRRAAELFTPTARGTRFLFLSAARRKWERKVRGKNAPCRNLQRAPERGIEICACEMSYVCMCGCDVIG